MIDCLLLEGITDWTKRTPRWDPEVGPLVNAGREPSFCLPHSGFCCRLIGREEGQRRRRRRWLA